MLIDRFSKDQKCPHGHLLNDLNELKAHCDECDTLGMSIIANYNSFQFALAGLKEVFHFNFVVGFGCFVWAFQRLFNVGDFNPDGEDDGFNFYALGLVKRKSRKRK